MTMPHLTNCAHSPDGWCLKCVGELYENLEKIKNLKFHPNVRWDRYNDRVEGWEISITDEDVKGYSPQCGYGEEYEDEAMQQACKFMKENNLSCK